MREAYFNPETISGLAHEWLGKYGKTRKDASQPFKIQQAGLLILDMQEYFLEPDSHAYVPGGKYIIPGLNKLAEAFRQAGRPVIATQHVNNAQDAGRMADWWSELITVDHSRVGLDQDLNISPAEIIQKSQYDAFYRSSLGIVLEDFGVSQLVIGGVMTHLCCETTARSAFVQGYEVFFLIDGTATYHQGFHTSSLENLAHGIAVLTTTAQMLERI